MKGASYAAVLSRKNEIMKASLGIDYDTYVWLRISCDQPFLAYASSVFEGGAPGSMPFEVFAPRLAVTGAP